MKKLLKSLIYLLTCPFRIMATIFGLIFIIIAIILYLLDKETYTLDSCVDFIINTFKYIWKP